MFKFAAWLGVFLAGAVLCAENVPFDVRAKAERMRENGQTCAGGTSEKFGVYIISLVDLELDGEIPMAEASELALAQGKREIAAFIGQEVSARDRVETTVTTIDDRTESKEFHESMISVNVNQFLRGVVLYDIRKTRKGVSAICFVTGRTMDMSRELQEQMAKLPPGTVSAVGVAYVVDGRLDLAKQQSLQTALRSAVEQVLGTTLAANTQVQDNEKVRSRIFAHASGFVEEYRIIEEGAGDGSYRTAIYARVAKDKLLESYSAYLKSFGDPLFCLRSGNRELYQTFAKFFVGFGLKLSADEKKADYLIDAQGDYRQLRHPASGMNGVQLSLWIRISDANTGRELLSQKNDPRRSAVFHASGERQKEIATEKAFAQIREPLHRELNRMIGQMASAGREITVVIDNYSTAYSEALELFCKVLEQVPGCGNVNRKIDAVSQTVTVTADYQGKMDDLADFLKARLRKEMPPKSWIPAVTAVETNRLQLTY